MSSPDSQFLLLELAFSLSRAHKNSSLVFKSFKALIEDIVAIYKNIEPMNYSGTIYIIKHFLDSDTDFKVPMTLCHNVLQHSLQNPDEIVLHIFQEDLNIYIYENESASRIEELSECLIYIYHNNAERMILNGTSVSLPRVLKGSTFSQYYIELQTALDYYRMNVVRFSSCEILKNIWHDLDNRYYLESNGSGNDEPEIHIQKSLRQFLSNYTSALRGTTVDVEREHNVIGTSSHKPVDLIVRWKDANRVALIEIKWLGKTKNRKGVIKGNNGVSRAINGLNQLYGYYCKQKTDTPSCNIRAQLVVLDARRLYEFADGYLTSKCGLHFQNEEIVLTKASERILEITDFERPARMFAEPNCRG